MARSRGPNAASSPSVCTNLRTWRSGMAPTCAMSLSPSFFDGQGLGAEALSFAGVAGAGDEKPPELVVPDAPFSGVGVLLLVASRIGERDQALLDARYETFVTLLPSLAGDAEQDGLPLSVR